MSSKALLSNVLAGTERGAVLSQCTQYRYLLWRVWQPNQRLVAFVGLNPSTADEQRDDPTIRRCVSFAKTWGYGGMIVANLFAYRATLPSELRIAFDPIGPENDDYLNILTTQCALVVACWGNHGTYLTRDNAVQRLFINLYALDLTKSGAPRHPLYVRGTATPILFLSS
jgi:hypothetical protein